MFQLVKGHNIPDISKLKEEYTVNENASNVTANISAEKIPAVFESFLDKMRDDEPLFLFIEAPCKEDDEWELNGLQPGSNNTIEKFHRDVYYLDGWYRENMRMFLQSGVGELLVNDGLVCFGFGSLESHIELGKYKYNILIGYPNGQDIGNFITLFDSFGIPQVSEMITAWDLISKDNPGESRKYEFKGKDIYTLIDQLEELGLYKAETREEDSGEVVWRA